MHTQPYSIVHDYISGFVIHSKHVDAKISSNIHQLTPPPPNFPSILFSFVLEQISWKSADRGLLSSRGDTSFSHP